MKRVSWALSFLVIVVTIISINNNREDEPNFLDGQLLEVKSYFAHRDIRKEEVSQVNVAWHLDHILKVVNNITEDLITSNPDDYIPKFNVQRIVVHTTGRIPRGRTQSPQNTTPPDKVLLDSLQLQLIKARQNLSMVSSLDKDAFFAHPVFDHLDRDQTRRFLEIHTNHHLKIIRDILGK